MREEEAIVHGSGWQLQIDFILVNVVNTGVLMARKLSCRLLDIEY
jgi:hypothetical protein